MMIVQLILYCLVFTAMVRFAVRGGAVDGLYFYPKPVQERALEIGLTTQEAVRRKRMCWSLPAVRNFIRTACGKCKNAGSDRFFGRDDKAGEAKM